MQNRGALRYGQFRPHPGLESSQGGSDGAIDVGFIGHGNLADVRAGGRVDDVQDGAVRCGGLGAVDQQAPIDQVDGGDGSSSGWVPRIYDQTRTWSPKLGQRW